AGVTVFADANANSQLDAGESSAITAGDGTYAIAGLPAGGSFTIRQALASGYYQTSPAAGTGRNVTITAGQTLSGNDFGQAHYATISGRIFQDFNANAVFDSGDTTAAGLRVYVDQ